MATIRLTDIASARSGDKGNHSNIGVVARSAEAYQFLQRVLTSAVIHEYFRDLGATRVDRFELPKVWALNFVLYNALAGGASQSLRIDTQGKLLGSAVLRLELPVDAQELPRLIRSEFTGPEHGTRRSH